MRGSVSGLDAWRAARRVLAVRLDNLGDLLMTTPALRAVRADGVRHVTLLASQAVTAAIPHFEGVDEAIPFNAPWLKHEAYAVANESRRCLEALRTRPFDAAIIFTVYTQSALPAATLLELAGIPRVLAYSRENPYHLVTDRIEETEPEREVRHEVVRQLDLVGSVGYRTDNDRLSFCYSDVDRRSMWRKLKAAGIDRQRPFVIVHPGASAPSRRYPAMAFGAAAELVAHRTHCQIVVTGNDAERAIVEMVRGRCAQPSVSVAGALSLGELGAAIDNARVIITNNSGPAHIAAALGTPVVDLYALTNPQHTPWRVPSRVLSHPVPCAYCYRSICPQSHHHCLRLVTPDAVAEAAVELYALERDDQSESIATPMGRWGIDQEPS